ncbi:MAG: hypothetical protein PHD51_02460 [Patescibacteria group bacterium]|nr:hypothetical protein [Patescibacteria group bacterium]MDD5490276.1 hypothetical protein [Patescibacteria group bacterium]
MNFNWKKIALIILFIAVVIAAGYLIYTAFLKPAITPPPVTTPPTVTPGLLPAGEERPGGITVPAEEVTPPKTAEPLTAPEVLPEGVSKTAKGGLTAVTTLVANATTGVTLDTDGRNLLYYNRNEGKFYRLTPEGKPTLLTDKTFYNVSDIAWSPTREKSVLEYPDGSNVIFNFKTGQQITLPKHWTDFNFSPTGDEIASKSIGEDVNNRWLLIANGDGSEAKAIQELGTEADKVIVDWSPNRQMVAMYANGAGADKQKLYFIGPNQENYKLLTLPGYGFAERWAPSGEQLLFSVYNQLSDSKPELWVSNIGGDETGSNRRPLNINTWADKCVFAEENVVYCAVPKSLPKGAALVADYKNQTADTLYKIDVATGIKTLLAETYGGTFTVKDIMVSQDQKFLFFTDYQTGNLHKIQLSE